MRVIFTCVAAVLFGNFASAQYVFEGTIDNDRWQNEVYLSIVEDYRSLDGVFEEQILSKIQTDSTGYFKFSGDQISDENRIYKLHVDNCSDFDQGSGHSFGHCEDSEDIIFIARNGDTIQFPLSFDAQMFCEISSTNEKTDALLKIDSLKERMKFAYGEFRSEANRILNNKKWFASLQDFSKSQDEPLSQLYVYAFLSDRSSNFHSYYLENVQQDSFYTDLLNELENTYPNTSFTNQYRTELNADRFMQQSNTDGNSKKWLLFLILSILLISIFFNVRLYRKLTKNSIKAYDKPIERLTKQEQTILELILENKSNKDIADSLFISVSTVKTHINNIYKKFQVRSRDEIKTLFSS